MNDIVSPPNYLFDTVLIVALAWGSYYLGIYIRKRVFETGPPLKDQFLLGIPVSLFTLAPLLPILEKTMSSWSVLATFALIIEHGMVVHEVAVSRVQSAINSFGNKESTPKGENAE